MSPQFDEEMRTRARVERVSRARGGKPQSVLAVAQQLRGHKSSSASASLMGISAGNTLPHRQASHHPLQELAVGDNRRSRVKGGHRKLELIGGGTRVAETRGRRKGVGVVRGRPKRPRQVTVRTDSPLSLSDEGADGDGGGERGGGLSECGSESVPTADTILNLSEHLETMTLEGESSDPVLERSRETDLQQPQRATPDISSFDPPSASTPMRMVEQQSRLPPHPLFTSDRCVESVPRSKHHRLSTTDKAVVTTTLTPGEESAEKKFVNSTCAGDHSTLSDCVLAEGTPSHLYDCGVFCKLRGECNH